MSPRKAAAKRDDWRTPSQMAEDRGLMGTWYRCRRCGQVDVRAALVLGDRAYCQREECKEALLLVSRAQSPSYGGKFNDVPKTRGPAARKDPAETSQEYSAPENRACEEAPHEDCEPADEDDIDEVEEDEPEAVDAEADDPSPPLAEEAEEPPEKASKSEGTQATPPAAPTGVPGRLADLVVSMFSGVGAELRYRDLAAKTLAAGRSVNSLGSKLKELEEAGCLVKVAVGVYRRTDVAVPPDGRLAAHRKPRTAAPAPAPQTKPDAPEEHDDEPAIVWRDDGHGAPEVVVIPPNLKRAAELFAQKHRIRSPAQALLKMALLGSVYGTGESVHTPPRVEALVAIMSPEQLEALFAGLARVAAAVHD